MSRNVLLPQNHQTTRRTETDGGFPTMHTERAGGGPGEMAATSTAHCSLNKHNSPGTVCNLSYLWPLGGSRTGSHAHVTRRKTSATSSAERHRGRVSVPVFTVLASARLTRGVHMFRTETELTGSRAAATRGRRERPMSSARGSFQKCF